METLSARRIRRRTVFSETARPDLTVGPGIFQSSEADVRSVALSVQRRRMTAAIVNGAYGKEPGRLSRSVMHALMQDLRDGRYERGARLPAERILALAMGVSRPIIREALHALDLLGVVETRVGSGTYVIDVDVDLGSHVSHAPAFEVLDTLSTLECSALVHAADRIEKTLLDALAENLEAACHTDGNFEAWHSGLAKFHIALAKASQNEVLSLMIGQLWQVRLGASVTRRFVQRAWLAGALADHAALKQFLAALRAGNHELASRELRAEHNRVLAAVLDIYAEDEVARARESVSQLRARFVWPPLPPGSLSPAR
jgi:GntR family transcriptional repressor for pyruvate dehydrogenase complex